MVLFFRANNPDPLGNVVTQLPEIDVVIPAAEKDFLTLPLVIEGLKVNCRNPIGRILIVSPRIDLLGSIREIDFRIELLSDFEVLNLDFEAMPREVQKIKGWLSQQLIKLQSVYLSDEKYILWLDADTILNSPRTFATWNRILELVSDEFHLPYFKGLNSIFGFRVPRFRLSRVSHHNLVCTDSLRDFFRVNSIRESQDLLDRILNCLDLKNDTSEQDCHIFGKESFSEYELNSLILKKYRVARKRSYWWNESRSELSFGNSFENVELGKFEFLTRSLRPNQPYSISFHTWNRSRD
jgi:hypothetical protein